MLLSTVFLLWYMNRRKRLAQKETINFPNFKWHHIVQYRVSELFITLIRNSLVQSSTLKRQVSFLNLTWNFEACYQTRGFCSAERHPRDSVLLQYLITKIKESTPDRSEPSESPFRHVTVNRRRALMNLSSNVWAAEPRPVGTRGELLPTV